MLAGLEAVAEQGEVVVAVVAAQARSQTAADAVGVLGEGAELEGDPPQRGEGLGLLVPQDDDFPGDPLQFVQISLEMRKVIEIFPAVFDQKVPAVDFDG